jgi:hypothetical protein
MNFLVAKRSAFRREKLEHSATKVLAWMAVTLLTLACSLAGMAAA